MSSWYDKYLPRIKEIKPHITEAIGYLKNIDGVKSVYIWGSYAKNIDKPNYRVRDIDVLARTHFHSGDLLSITDQTVTDLCSDSYLENQGYDPEAIKFSKNFLSLSKYNIDPWAISSDRKLVHWGPICVNKKESEEVGKEAEKYADKSTGVSRNKINKSSENIRKNWYNHYCHYINECFKDMPTGWYKTEDIKVKDITIQALMV